MTKNDRDAENYHDDDLDGDDRDDRIDYSSDGGNEKNFPLDLMIDNRVDDYENQNEDNHDDDDRDDNYDYSWDGGNEKNFPLQQR